MTSTHPAGRRRRTALAAIAMLLVTACSSTIKPGLPGSEAKGALVGDSALQEKVTKVLLDWKAPTGSLADVTQSALLWADSLDGKILAVSSVQDVEGTLWTVEASGDTVGDLAVSATTRLQETKNPGEADLVPIRSACCGPRYLLLNRSKGITFFESTRLAVTNGMTERVSARRCVGFGVEVERSDGTVAAYLDLGLGTNPAVPQLLSVEELIMGRSLGNMDTCKETTDPNGVIQSVLKVTGASTVTKLETKINTLPSRSLGTSTVLTYSWTTPNGPATSFAWHDSSARPNYYGTPAELPTVLHALPISLPSGPATILAWDSNLNATLEVEPGVTVLAQTVIPGGPYASPAIVTVPPGATKIAKLKQGDKVIATR